MLRRNLIANYLGQAWAAVMSLAFVPFYIHYLGIESYGLIGLFSLLQSWLSLLDVGLTPTLGREMARFTAGSHSAQSIGDVLRSIECIAVSIAATIALVIMASAHWIALHWLKTDTVPIDVASHAFTAMGGVTALRFVEGIYRSSLIGLQRQVLFNVVNSCIATVRGLGAVAVVALWSPTIMAFFMWQGLISLISLAALALLTYLYLPPAARLGRFSPDALRGVYRFAGGMLLMSLLVLALTNVDKLLLSSLVPLSEYGYYTLAATVAGGLYYLSMPVIQAVQPRLTELHAASRNAEFTQLFHHSSQLVAVALGGTAVAVIVNADILLSVWTRDEVVTRHAAPLLRVIAAGTLLNGMMGVPYVAQLATGWTRLSIVSNIIAVCLLVPLVFLVVPTWGAIGNAWVWVLLNVGYFMVATHFMFARILVGEKWRWYVRDVLMPLGCSLFISLALRSLPPWPMSPLFGVAWLIALFTASVGGGLLAASELRTKYFMPWIRSRYIALMNAES